MAFVVSNALMLSTPFKALAETCEANNSVFNMNMPLLLSVALIGATVGGKVLIGFIVSFGSVPHHYFAGCIQNLFGFLFYFFLNIFW